MEKKEIRIMAFEKNGSLTIEQIKEAEEKLGHKFPDDYKEFLLKTNGGRIDFVSDDVDHSFHVDPIDEEDVCIDSLYGVGEDALDLLIKYNKEYGEETGGCIIIGDTLSHGFITYDYLGVVEEEGGIYFWDDTWTYEPSNEECNLYFVANDFNELLKLCNLKLD